MKIFVSKTIPFLKIISILKKYHYGILKIQDIGIFNMIVVDKKEDLLNVFTRETSYCLTVYSNCIVIHRISD